MQGPSGSSQKTESPTAKRKNSNHPKVADKVKGSKATTKERAKSTTNPKTSMKDSISKNGKSSKPKKDDRRSDTVKEKSPGDPAELDPIAEQESPSRKERAQSKASFPLTRIKMIMKSAPEVNTLGVDAVALTARAAELFVVHLANEALKKGRASTVDYSDIYTVVHDNPILDFLYDIIPQKIPFRECLAEIEEADRKEKEELDRIEI